MGKIAQCHNVYEDTTRRGKIPAASNVSVHTEHENERDATLHSSADFMDFLVEFRGFDISEFLLIHVCRLIYIRTVVHQCNEVSF